MHKQTIKYVDYDGNEREEDFYFNLNKSELIDLEFTREGGLADYLKKIIASNDKPTIYSMFKKILLMSYGEKSPDGKRFIKSEEISKAFSETEAYNQLFLDLCSNEGRMAAFVNAIIPADLSGKVHSNTSGV